MAERIAQSGRMRYYGHRSGRHPDGRAIIPSLSRCFYCGRRVTDDEPCGGCGASLAIESVEEVSSSIYCLEHEL